MTAIPQEVADFMNAYGLAKDDIWPVPGGRSFAVKHKALERIAAEKGIAFDLPQIVEGNSTDKTVVLLVTAKMGERVEWSFGEASPSNNKNAYCWAMAEKRAKDRLILKLLNAHGAVYSEEEADDFKQGAPAPVRLSSNAIKKNNPDFWPELERTVRACATLEDLRAVFKEYRERVAALPGSWQEQWDELITAQRDSIMAVAA